MKAIGKLIILLLIPIYASANWTEPEYRDNPFFYRFSLALKYIDNLWMDSGAKLKFGSCEIEGESGVYKGIGPCVYRAIKEQDTKDPRSLLPMIWHGNIYNIPFSVKLRLDGLSLWELIWSGLSKQPGEMAFSIRGQILESDKLTKKLIEKFKSSNELDGEVLAQFLPIVEDNPLEYFALESEKRWIARDPADPSCMYDLGYRELDEKPRGIEWVSGAAIVARFVTKDGKKLGLGLKHDYYPSIVQVAPKFFHWLGVDGKYCFNGSSFDATNE